MKKMKKFLLWSIVPILGVSGAVAGVVAATTTHQTSIVSSSTIEDATSGKNSSSSTIEAVDNESNSSNSTGTSVSNVTSGNNTTTSTSTTTSSSLKITYLGKNFQTFSESSTNVAIYATGTSSYLNYKWYVDKNDGKGYNLLSSSSIGSTSIDAPKTSEVLNWTLKCVVYEKLTNQSITSDEIQLSILPKDGRYITVTQQPTSALSAKGGELVTLSTSAKQSGSLHQGKLVGYQWFKYNSLTKQYVAIENATSATYSFNAGYYDATTVEKYVCRYYFIDSSSSKVTYLSESNVATVTVEPGKKVEEQVKINSLTASATSINSKEETTLSVSATSNLTNSLTYQWYKADANGEFKAIDNATSSTYKYIGEEVESSKDVTFMVMVKGKDYYLQSSNLIIRVNPVGESTVVETPTNELKIKATVVQNQAPVNSEFVSWATINSYWYSVEVTEGVSSTDNITYQWYYAGSDGVEHEISGANSATLTPNTDLFKNIYTNNSSHRAQIICKVYKNGKLSNVVDQSTYYKFYMSVGIVTRA